jgi:hypothetical protein
MELCTVVIDLKVHIQVKKSIESEIKSSVDSFVDNIKKNEDIKNKDIIKSYAIIESDFFDYEEMKGSVELGGINLGVVKSLNRLNVCNSEKKKRSNESLSDLV